MQKKTKYQFNQQLATQNLLSEAITFAITNPRLDDLYNMEFGPADYIEKEEAIYYVATPNEYDRFLDFAMSKGFDVNRDVIEVDDIKEISTSSGAGAYNPSLHASKKKRNPFKEHSEFFESVLSGYKELTGFKPGHTPDRGGFQYKELWETEYEQNEAYTPTKTNVEELARVEGLLAKAHDENSFSVMSAYESRINQLRLLVAIEKKIGKPLPVLSFGEDFIDYVRKEFGYKGPVKYSRLGMLRNAREISDFIISSQTQNLNENYARFKNETKTRSGSEQYHQAVKAVKRKVQEIGKLHTYLERMQKELSETQDGLKKKKYTEIAIAKIKEEVRQLNKKLRKLK